jgi:hypothetical protein
VASGNSQISMSRSYRTTPSTVHSVIIFTCTAILKKVSPLELPQPTEAIWKKIAEEFDLLWQFSNYIRPMMGNILRYMHHVS